MSNSPSPFMPCGTSTGTGNTNLPFSQAKKAPPATPQATKAPAAPAASRPEVGGRVGVFGRAALLLVSSLGFWIGRPAAKTSDPQENMMVALEAPARELDVRLSETSAAQSEISEELRLARELREVAERRLHDCKAYGPEYC